METVASESSLVVNFYLDGELVLTVMERDGEAAGELTEHGLALSPERAAELVSDLEAALPSIMSAERCPDQLRSKTDEKAKCDLIGIGSGILAGLLCGGLCGTGVGGVMKVACNWIVDKACEKNSEGC